MRREDVEGAARNGPRERLLAGGGWSIGRIPLLRTVLADMASRLEGELRGMCDPSSKFSVADISARPMEEVARLFEDRAMTAVYAGAEKDSKCFVGVDRKFLYALVDASFGADGSESLCEDERSPSNVETQLGRFVFSEAMKALQTAFSSVADILFETERVHGERNIGADGHKNAFAALCRYKLSALDREGEMMLAIPQALLDPFRDVLSREPSIGAPLLDSDWTKRMESRVTRTEVSVHAVMERSDFTLGDVARLEVGQIVELPISPTSLIKLECEGRALFWCELGQKNGIYTVRIENQVDQEQEFIDDVLGE